jgi:hypothetical protein
MVLVLPLLFIARDRVNSKALVVFILNNWIGPDSYWTFIFIPVYGHSALGFLIWAIPLAFFYAYLSRFTLIFEGRKPRLIDQEAVELTWRHAYLLTIAGGLCHFFIDMVGHTDLMLSLVPGWDATLQQVQLWGIAYYHNYTAWILIGFLFQVLLCVAMLYIMTRDVKDVLVWLGSTVLLALIFIGIIGGETFGELELPTLLLIGAYFLIPLGLLGYVLRDLYDRPVKITTTRLSPLQKLRVATGVMTVFGLLITGASLFAIFQSQTLGELFDFDGDVIRQLAFVAIFIGGVITIVALGMGIWKSWYCRRILMGMTFLMLPIVFPFTIFLILKENAVKALFKPT